MGRRMAFAAARDAGGTGDCAPHWGVAPPAHRLMSIYSVVKELITNIRGAANGKGETSRGRKSPAQEYM
jgi:hypothetical protein